jgi:hypothetical protein
MMDYPFGEAPPTTKRSPRALRRVALKLRPKQGLLDAPAHPASLDGLFPGMVRRVRVDQPEQKPLPGSARSAAEFCRQARKLRAVYERNPVKMHHHLSRLSTGTTTDTPANPTDRPGLNPTTRGSRAIRWTWTQTARLGKSGISLLGKLGRGLSMSGADNDPVRKADLEDELPRYTLADPDEPPMEDDYAGALDRTFGALVTRTLTDLGQSPLRYSQRLELLKEAGRRGIGRFEANLIIASVQHRMKISAPVQVRKKPLRFGGALSFVLVQTMILWGVWRATRS